MNPETVGVTATTREMALETDDVSERIDILCDSTSVTFERSKKYLFTPLVFASGVSYAVSRSARDREEAAFVAAVSQSDASGTDTTALPSVPTCNDMDAAGIAPVFRIGVLAGTTAVEAVKHEKTQRLFRLNRGADRGERVCIEQVRDGGYLEGIKRLCRGEYSYFFGDRDLLVRRLESHLAQQPDPEAETATPCDAELSSAFYSFEPYAIAVRADRPDLYLKVQTSVFKFFSDPERVRTLFREKFGEQARPSELVESLFRLNSLGQVE
jgi:ABC-type amino acid transport substrate-binding protein